MYEDFNFIKIIKEILEGTFKSGLTLSELERLSGVDRRTFSMYRRGEYAVENMSLDIAQKLLSAYPIVNYINNPYYIDEINNLHYILHFPELDDDLREDKSGREYFYCEDSFIFWQEVADATEFIIKNNISLGNTLAPRDYIRLWKENRKPN